MQGNAKLKTRIKQLERERNASNTVLFPSYSRNLRTVDGQPICKRYKTVGHIEPVSRQNSCNHQHNTNLCNSQLSSRNTFNMRGSTSFNRRVSPNNQYMHSRHSQQEDSLNQYDQQGQHSYPVEPTNIFNTYHGNQGNSDRANGHMDMSCHKNHSHASISQEKHHNSGHDPNSLQGSAETRHFHPLGRGSNLPLNQNTNQDQPLHTNTITQEIKQHNPPNTIIKGKINNCHLCVTSERA